MQTFKFKVSDEALNSYGCVVQTSGIHLEAFVRNPIMLYMHDRKQGVIGRWENVRKEGDKLFAEAVFDEDTELGAKVKHQVETGFLRAASIGIDNCNRKTINGIETIISCDLIEISIVDVPANKNAVKLFNKGWIPVNSLVDLKLNEPESKEEKGDLRSRLVGILGLPAKATDNEIISQVKALLNQPATAEKEVDKAVKYGLIPARDKDSFLAMAQGNIKAFRGYCNMKMQAQEAEMEQLLNDNPRKVLYAERQVFRDIGKRMGVDTLRRLLDCMYTVPRLSEFIDSGYPGDKSQWTLNEYRKYAPEELNNNPTLYKQLMMQEKGADTEVHYNSGNPVKDLYYYRTHEPEYLAAHPEFYKQLLDNVKRKHQINHGS